MNISTSVAPAQEFATAHPNLLIAIHRALALVATRGGAMRGYFEFGVYRGFSFWFANNLANEIGLSLDFHGFDSFEGLPVSEVDQHRNWAPGSYACSLEEVANYLEKWRMPLPYTLHKGWYSAPLFAEVEQQHALPAVAVAVIDCDMYESAAEVLRMLARYIRVGTLLLFDDFNSFGADPNHGERRALSEFERTHPNFRKSPLFAFGPYGQAFEVTAV